MKKGLIVVITFLVVIILAPSVLAYTYYISPVTTITNNPDGSISYPGIDGTCPQAENQTTPCATFANAMNCLQPGDTLYLEEGTYNQQLKITASGSSVGGYITIAAQHEGSVTIQTNDISALLIPSPGYSYLEIVGINFVVTDDGTGPTNQHGINVNYGDHVNLRRNIVTGSAGYNAHNISYYYTSNFIIEDNACTGKGRVCLNVYRTGQDPNNNNSYVPQQSYVRRNYMLWTGPVESGDNGNCSQSYDSNNVTWENNICAPLNTNVQGMATWAHEQSLQGNLYYGNITHSAPGISITGGLDDFSAYPNHTNGSIYNNNVVIFENDPYNTALCSESNGSTWTNNTFIARGSTLGGGLELELTPNDSSGTGTIANASNNSFLNTWTGYSRDGSAESLQMHDYNNFWNLTQTNPPYGYYNFTPGTNIDAPVPGANDTQTDPAYPYSTYGLGAYLMASKSAVPTVGANVIYEYVNGTITNTPLWPWPMEGRIQAFLTTQCNGGPCSATYSSVTVGGTTYTGGLWNTLTGVYSPGTCTTSAPTVSITPSSQTITSGGSDTYTISITNNDSGTGCTNTTFSLAAADTNSANFNASTASPASVALSPGANGTSTLTVTAKAAQTSGADSTTVTATASGHANTISNAVSTTIATSTVTAFAVNAGGGQYTDTSGNLYQADTDYSGGSTASTTAAITGTSDPTLYQTERYGNFSYNIPLSNGNYTVTLKFAEIYWTQAGKRIFNVSMQGTQVISNLDIFAQVGKDVAYDLSFPVSVTNGTLNITFTSVEDHAKVSAIEITSASSLSPDTTPPTVPAGVTATPVSSSQINISWAASTDPVVAGQVTSGVAGYKIFRNGTQVGTATATNYSDTGLPPSTNYSYTVSADDAAGNNSAQSSTATATTLPPSGSVVFATNSGGVQYTSQSSGIVYQADRDYSGGSTDTTTATITGTLDPTLYQSERWGNFSYNIPLSNGNYNVTLKFAEIYWNQAGKRTFNVRIQGTQVITNLDIFAQVGKDAAYDLSFPVSVTNGTLNITFTPIEDNAKVSAIEITSQ